jgi:hypothetical protein
MNINPLRDEVVLFGLVQRGHELRFEVTKYSPPGWSVDRHHVRRQGHGHRPGKSGSPIVLRASTSCSASQARWHAWWKRARASPFVTSIQSCPTRTRLRQPGLAPDARPLDRGKPRDVDTEGGNQPADKSLIDRRLSLRSRLCAAMAYSCRRLSNRSGVRWRPTPLTAKIRD